jgi:hypothetical protein
MIDFTGHCIFSINKMYFIKLAPATQYLLITLTLLTKYYNLNGPQRLHDKIIAISFNNIRMT